MNLDPFSAHRHDRDSLAIDPATTALLVVDMINDFCTPGGAMVLPGAERLYPPQNTLIAAARDAGMPVVQIIDSHRPGLRDDREFRKRTPHAIEGSWGAQVVAELEQRPEDIRVLKRRYSAFYNTDLHLTLQDMGIDTVIVIGVVTNICVRSTVHDAFFHGYEVAVPEDCVAATGPREQISSLYDIATHFGTVTDSADLIRALADGVPVRNREIPA
ncbi:cysteine hydrolase family protein [Marinibaculum pumilum]|uniref:Cysteine hydrolase family protein n=1 Tax=Marinibaculum pumilum TaxID=1766165 RepID=A0ABV7L064_9PROT